MKKILLSLCATAMLGFSGKAQTTLFTQDFSSSTTVTDYVRTNATSPVVAIGDNMLTSAAASTASPVIGTVSINANKLRFARVAGTSPSNGTMWASRTAQSAAPNGKLATTASQVLKVAFEITVSDFTAATNVAFFQVGGNGLHNQGFSSVNTADAATTPVHSAFSLTTVYDNANSVWRYRFSRPTGAGIEGAEIDGNVDYSKSYVTGSTQQISWYINNRGQGVTYTGPDNTTTYTLANDTYDLYVGNTRILAGRPANNGAQDINNFVIGFRNLLTAITVDIDDIVIQDITAITTLPVSLTSFTGKNTLAGNLLTWQTASEQQNSHFEILRSTNGSSFSQIGRVAGKGTTSQISNYQFTDRMPLQGANYYKLKQVDFNGDSKESEIEVVNALGKQQNVSVTAKGNEVQVSFYAEKAGAATVKIHDINGRTLLSQQVNATAGLNTVSYVLNNTSTGIYIGAVSVDGKVQTVKFNK